MLQIKKEWVQVVDAPGLEGRILDAIKQAGLTQTEACKKLGFSRQYFHRYLRGSVAMPIEVLQEIERMTGENFEVELGENNG